MIPDAIKNIIKLVPRKTTLSPIYSLNLMILYTLNHVLSLSNFLCLFHLAFYVALLNWFVDDRTLTVCHRYSINESLDTIEP